MVMVPLVGMGLTARQVKGKAGGAMQGRCWLLVGMHDGLQDQVALINGVAAEVQQQTGGWAEKGGIASLSVGGRSAGD